MNDNLNNMTQPSTMMEDEGRFINPDYTTNVVWKDGTTWVRCRHCSAEQPCDGDPKQFPHGIICPIRIERKEVKTLVQEVNQERTERTGEVIATGATPGINSAHGRCSS